MRFRPQYAGCSGTAGRDMGEKMIELKPITEENFLDAFHLKLAAGQERFVSHPIRSLAQAYVYRNQCSTRSD